MVEDKFEVLSLSGQPDDVTVSVKCNDCSTAFEVRLNILKPKNCRHELGKSLTVFCPSCNVESTTTENENQIKKMEGQVAALQARVEKYFSANRFKFLYHGIVDDDKSVMRLECADCKHAFVANMKTNENVAWWPQQMTITCPQCKAAETTTLQRAAETMEITSVILELVDLENELKQMKGEGGGTETVQETP